MCIVSLLSSLLLLTSHVWLPVLSLNNLYFLGNKPQFFFVVGDILQHDSFRDILYTLCVDELPKVGCDSHFLKLMTNLIYDFMIIRYKYIANQISNDLSGAIITRKHAQSKLSKM